MGYAGNQDALPLVLEGLRRLEYRGYDSAGVAVLVEQDPDPARARARPREFLQSERRRRGHQRGGLRGTALLERGERARPQAKVVLRRAPGKLDRLIGAIDAESSAADGAGGALRGRVAIGHTRWATHGSPTERNAHPHADCRGETVVAHNGIVENYEPLRAELQQEGHHFASETDSEVIAHLIEREVSRRESLVEATRRALLSIRGANAITVLHPAWPDLLVAGRTGHAGGLVLGPGRGGDVRRLRPAGHPGTHPLRDVPGERGDGRGGCIRGLHLPPRRHAGAAPLPDRALRSPGGGAVATGTSC